MNDENLPTSMQTLDMLFLANFVHQVVNPLNGIAGTLDNIVDGTYTGEIVKKKANAARGQLEACISLIRNLAFFADISSSNDVLREPTATGAALVPQMIIESLQFYQDAATDRKIRIEMTDRQTQYAVRARPEALKQVFMNLFDNATKYADAESIVTVTQKVQAKGVLCILVSNVGIGFSGTERERIFDLSYRSSTAKNSKALGSGIGLYICRRIMTDFLGGSITAEHNNRTRTTTFSLKFPQHKWFKQ